MSSNIVALLLVEEMFFCNFAFVLFIIILLFRGLKKILQDYLFTFKIHV